MWSACTVYTATGVASRVCGIRSKRPLVKTSPRENVPSQNVPVYYQNVPVVSKRPGVKTSQIHVEDKLNRRRGRGRNGSTFNRHMYLEVRMVLPSDRLVDADAYRPLLSRLPQLQQRHPAAFPR